MATPDASCMVVSHTKDELALVPRRSREDRPHTAHAEARGVHSGRGEKMRGCNAHDPSHVRRVRMCDLPDCGHAYGPD
jgi:hypothetical protein